MNAAWWRDTWLFARREIDERSRARSFRITTVIMIVAVAAAVVIPALISHHHKAKKVGLLGGSHPTLTQAAIAAGRVTGNRVQVVTVGSLGAARAELRSGALAAVIVDGREVLIKQQPVSGTTSSTATFAGALAQLVGVAQRLPAGASQSALTNGIAIPIRGVEPAPRSLANRFTGLGVDLLIYLVIFFYGMAITQSVGEEKTSRVVEVLLATVRPTQLLTGKVIGFAGLAFAQMLVPGPTFVVCGVAVGSHALRGTAGAVALIGALWLILGYALYCSAFAAAGAMITRQSDAGYAAFPLLIPLIAAYSLSSSCAVQRRLPLLPRAGVHSVDSAGGDANAIRNRCCARLADDRVRRPLRARDDRNSPARRPGLPAFRYANRRPRQAPPSPARRR